MSLEKLLNEMRFDQDLLAQDLEEVPSQFRPSRAMAQAQARDRLKESEKKLAEQVLRSSLVMALVGKPSAVAQFAEIARKEGNTLNLDGEALYRRLATPAEKAIGATRVFTIACLAVLLEEGREVMRELGVMSLPGVALRDAVVCPTFQDMVNKARELTSSGFGPQLNRAWLVKDLIKQVRDIRYTSNVIPVIITGLTEDEAKVVTAEFGCPVTEIVEVPEEPSKEQVLKLFGAMKKRLKQQK